MSEFQTRCENVLATARQRFQQSRTGLHSTTISWGLPESLGGRSQPGLAMPRFSVRTSTSRFSHSFDSRRSAKSGKQAVSRHSEKMITVRLAVPMHDSLLAEAEDLKTSLSPKILPKPILTVTPRKKGS